MKDLPDVSAAFQAVDYDILLPQNLQTNYGICVTQQNLIWPYLIGQTHYISRNAATSGLRRSSGGSVLHQNLSLYSENDQPDGAFREI